MSRKLIGAFVAIALIVALCGSLSYAAIQRVQHQYEQLIERNSQVMAHISTVLTRTEQQNGLLFQYLEEPDAGAAQALMEANTQLGQEISSLHETVKGDDGADALAEANKTFERLVEKVMGYVKASKMDIARSEAKQWAVPNSQELSRQANKISESEQQTLEQAMSDNRQEVTVFANLLIAVSLLAVVLAVAIGWMLSRMIVKPAKRLLLAAEGIAAGDLTGEAIVVRSKDELRMLADAFNAMKVKLRHLILQASSNANQVAVASVQLHANSDRVTVLSQHAVQVMTDIVEGAARQQAQIARGHELIAQTAQSALLFEENAGRVSSAVARAAGRATEGNASIGKAHSQIGLVREVMSASSLAAAKLQRAAEQLDRLTASISNIARQTNMLALNAAIEASRAGVQGKGFAVVADEIRKLSTQTGHAAQEAASLIGGIQVGIAEVAASSDQGDREAEAGMDTVSLAAGAFAEIAQAIQEIEGRMREMSKRTTVLTAQSHEAAEAMEAVHALSVTASAGASGARQGMEEQHGAMGEIAASSALLSGEAEQLQHRIAQFRVGEGA